MSDQTNMPVDPVGVTEGPPSKKPCTIDTPPLANTPDDSDFYNTPLNAGTPVGHQTAEASVPKSEQTVQTTSAPLIPGLGLVNVQSDQPAEHSPVKQEQESTAMKQETAESQVKMEENTASIQNDQTESLLKQEPVQEAPSDAMEVDQKPEPTAGNTTETTQEQQEDGQAQEEEGEHPEWEVDSNPYESSDDSSSDSDSSDSDDDEDYPILSPEEQARILMLAEGGSDDEGDKGKSGGHIRSTNEVADDVLPIPDVTITPDMKIVYLGKVQAAIDTAVLVEANTSGEYQVLESGSLLCAEDRKILGVVTETLGRVEHPLYTLMYSTAEEVQERGLVKDLPVYYVEAHSTFVFTQPLKGMKGSDASNFHDEEVAEDEIEFSDDEAEADYRRKLKQKRQERKDAKDGGKSKRGAPGPSKLSQTELNYDDDGGEEGYTPLARPKNYHEMMGPREAPIEGGDRGPSFRGGRGRGGRGNDRGRGARGRGGRGRDGHGDRDQDRRPHQQGGQHGGSSYSQPAPAQPQQPAYPQQQFPFAMPQAFPGFPQFPQQYAPQQQGQAPQAAPTQFPFQFPFQPGFPQQNPFQTIPQGAHINPLFFAALQQQQQQQQHLQQQQPQYQQGQQAPAQAQQPNQSMNFDQVQAQLDILRNLSNNQGPPRS